MFSAARAAARAASSIGGERVEIEAERDDAVLIGAADAVVVEQLVADPRRDRDDGDR